MSTYTPTWTHTVATVAQKCPACGGQINYLCFSDLPLFDFTLSPPTASTHLLIFLSLLLILSFFLFFHPSLSPVDMWLLFLDVKPLSLPALVCVWYLPKLLWSGLVALQREQAEAPQSVTNCSHQRWRAQCVYGKGTQVEGSCVNQASLFVSSSLICVIGATTFICGVLPKAITRLYSHKQQ